MAKESARRLGIALTTASARGFTEETFGRGGVRPRRADRRCLGVPVVARRRSRPGTRDDGGFGPRSRRPARRIPPLPFPAKGPRRPAAGAGGPGGQHSARVAAQRIRAPGKPVLGRHPRQRPSLSFAGVRVRSGRTGGVVYGRHESSLTRAGRPAALSPGPLRRVGSYAEPPVPGSERWVAGSRDRQMRPDRRRKRVGSSTPVPARRPCGLPDGAFAEDPVRCAKQTPAAKRHEGPGSAGGFGSAPAAASISRKAGGWSGSSRM